MSARIGYYCWGGPGTIRMIRLKFFHPQIDERSLMSSYDTDYLAKVQEKFGVTDVWATYSWGFSSKTEKQDYQFLLHRINNFKKLGLKLHAYVQGTNLVATEFPNQDYYCRDEHNRFITYYRGRLMTCVNNPAFQQYFFSKLESMIKLPFDGVYVDNIFMGQIPMPIYKKGIPYIFAGCKCQYCVALFKKQTGYEIPSVLTKNKHISEHYLEFRNESTIKFLRKGSQIVRGSGMEFGSNSSDPKHNMRLMYGIDWKDVVPLQDYVLFENHSLPRKRGKKNNAYINDIAKQIKKPVFVVSYKKGIGFDKYYSQKDMDRLYTEQIKSNFYLCLKGSEYKTNNIWHNLYIDRYTSPQTNFDDYGKISLRLRLKVFRHLLKIPFWKRLIRRYYNPAMRLYMENPYVRKMFQWIYPRLI